MFYLLLIRHEYQSLSSCGKCPSRLMYILYATYSEALNWASKGHSSPMRGLVSGLNLSHCLQRLQNWLSSLTAWSPWQFLKRTQKCNSLHFKTFSGLPFLKTDSGESDPMLREASGKTPTNFTSLWIGFCSCKSYSSLSVILNTTHAIRRHV